MAKKAISDIAERVTRDQFLAERGLAPCPCHTQCATDWGIPVTYDVCPRETGGSVEECPSLSQEGDNLAYQSLAADGGQEAGADVT